MTVLNMANIQELKENGFLQQAEPDRFALRVRVTAGQLTAANLVVVSEIAEKYGNGTVHFTSRQAVEVPHIAVENIETVKQLLSANGLEPGVLGARVRTITACQGMGVCKHGKIKTAELANRLNQITDNIELPHKFKIGVTGCCNNCMKAEENDLGIKGGVLPSWQPQNCNYCGACARKCPVNAIKVDKEKQKLVFDEASCINCGRCVSTCPKKAWQGKQGYLLYFGGTFGNRILIGQQVLPMVFTQEAVEDLVLKALEFYQAHGKKNERFGFMLEKVGLDKLRQALTDYNDVEAIG